MSHKKSHDSCLCSECTKMLDYLVVSEQLNRKEGVTIKHEHIWRFSTKQVTILLTFIGILITLLRLVFELIDLGYIPKVI